MSKESENIQDYGKYLAEELYSQPRIWQEAIETAKKFQNFPSKGEKVAIVGCGTSWFMAQSYASLREKLGQGITDAFTASEFPTTREYDLLILITRSGTTSEILELLRNINPQQKTLGIVGDENTEFSKLVDNLIALPFADEKSVVQTRFATSALCVLRTSLGEDLNNLITQAEKILNTDIPEYLITAKQYSFLGQNWCFGLANEAALKLRESCQAWTESYNSMEYRHGPIAIAEKGRIVWVFGKMITGLEEDIKKTGATTVTSDIDPIAHLVFLHKLCLEKSLRMGLNPDNPRNLSRSVILEKE